MDNYFQFAKVNIAENPKLAKKYNVNKKLGKITLFHQYGSKYHSNKNDHRLGGDALKSWI